MKRSFMLKYIFLFYFIFIKSLLCSDEQTIINIPELCQDEIICSLEHCYTCVKELGRGAFGVVYEVVDSHNQKYALKLFNNSSLKTGFRTFKISQYLNHPNIIKAIDYHSEDCDEKAKDFAVLEYVEGTPLNLFPNNSFSLKETERLLDELIDTVCFAYLQGYVHQDLNEENIMIDKDFHIKIIDIDSFIDINSFINFLNEQPLFFDLSIIRACLFIINKSNISRDKKNDLRIRVQQVSWDYFDDSSDGVAFPLIDYYNRFKHIFN